MIWGKLKRGGTKSDSFSIFFYWRGSRSKWQNICFQYSSCFCFFKKADTNSFICTQGVLHTGDTYLLCFPNRRTWSMPHPKHSQENVPPKFMKACKKPSWVFSRNSNWGRNCGLWQAPQLFCFKLFLANWDSSTSHSTETISSFCSLRTSNAKPLAPIHFHSKFFLSLTSVAIKK